MLKLKRVELHGFKSFFEKTEMRFNGSGIAAVVGPNGCGKSNLSDAISWVLGEQSAKTLRGSRMEDVIFAGTRERKPLGMASVTMTLIDPALHLPAIGNGHTDIAPPANGAAHVEENVNGHASAHTNGRASKGDRPSEVTITRRLFRSGESEYLINGKQARLRDIQDLFLGTGLGPESYAIIEQGRIGQILSNKPQDRRSVIEEAAGITKFKTRKRLAEAKLEGAKQNLTRVFDILEEVGRQVNSLKRQASKAKRFDELHKEMVTQLRKALSGRFRMLEREAAKTALDLNIANSEYQALATQVGENDTEHERLQDQCFRLDAELTEARKQLSELQLDQERTRGRLESQARQIATIENRLGQGETEAQELEKRQDVFQQELATHVQTLAELEQQTESSRELLTAKTAEREALQKSLQDRTRTLETGRQQVLKLLGEASALKNQLAQIDEYLSAMDRDTARTQREEEAALADLSRLESARGDNSRKISARQQELQSIVAQRREAEEELSVRKSKSAQTRRDLEQLRAEASQINARRDSLEQVISHRSYTTESVKRLFTAIESGQARDFKPVGVLADFVEVDANYEKATEEFLHEELEYVVVKDWPDAERGIDLMRQGLDGRATFLVEWKAEGSTAPSDEPIVDPGILGRLSDHIRFTNGLTQAPASLLPRLANCYLAEDRALAQQLAIAHPDVHFLLPDGVSYHGQAVSGGKKKGSGPLGLKRELREVTRQATAKQQAMEDTRKRLEDLENEIAFLTEDLDRLRAAQQTQEKEALALEHESRKLGEEFSRATSRLNVARLELDRLRQERQRATEQRERNVQLVDEKEAARIVQEDVLDQSRTDFNEMQAEAERVSDEHAELRADLAGFEERRRAERSSQARLENQIREVVTRRQGIAAEMERLGVERARLLSDNIELDQRANQFAERITGVEEVVGRLAEAETASRADLATVEEALKQLRVDSQAAMEKRSQVELELVKRQAELKFLDETSRKELNAPVEELASTEETVADETTLHEAEEQYQELRAKIDALGPVNTSALEEYQEAQQRYDFLNAQRQDLLDSIRDTEKAIHEIDAESRKRFAEAFQTININFREMFTTLFGGGLGEMRLTDEENIAESGIDIVASPPGKKLQNVLLLSGGEKSLTAMALLMAIFQYQPSPFCILDEVDAPLDEPNIERLTRLLKEMSSQTQFIVITHAKRTMESAQALYGVTMQEPGISKLVSVKFQNGTPAPPAQRTLQEVRPS
ncbi:MAG TPA: chromosome segregation protein SMC [Bryobacteraceae bacterium]|nr:chromosome segregation protein SMC [Bryobacteraceae bacterium]